MERNEREFRLASAAPQENRGRLDGVQYLRGFAALGVVLDHAGATIAAPQYQGNLAYLAPTYPLRTGVDLFFVISGFVMALPVLGGRPPRVMAFLFARVARIYPLAILTSLTFALAAWVIGSGYNSPLLPGLVTSVLLVPSPYEPIPAVLWTLKQEILFYLLFLTVLVHQRFGFALLFAWCLASIVLVEAKGLEPGPNWLASWFFHGKNVGFGFGILACLAYHGIPTARPAALVAAVAGGAAFLVASYTLNDDMFRVKTLVVGTAAALLVYGMAKLEMKRIALFLLLGTASYSIYLIHYLAISAAQRVLRFVAWPDSAEFIVVLLAALTAGILYFTLFETRFESWRKAWQRRLF